MTDKDAGALTKAVSGWGKKPKPLGAACDVTRAAQGQRLLLIGVSATFGGGRCGGVRTPVWRR